MKRIAFLLAVVILFASCFFGCNNTEDIHKNDDTTVDRYLKFENAVNANEYDKWFQRALDEDSLPIKEIYSKYVSFWKNELAFTLKEAQTLFEDQNEYLMWKYEIEQWLEITKASHNSEIKYFNAQMTRLEITDRYNKLIRQKVIDVKFFCYKLENHIYDVPCKDSIGLKWLNDISI